MSSPWPSAPLQEYMVEQAALFMFENGTVLSIFQTQDTQITEPIMDRLRVRRSTAALLLPRTCCVACALREMTLTGRQQADVDMLLHKARRNSVYASRQPACLARCRTPPRTSLKSAPHT
jgi:hypothetical protein